MLFKKKKNCKLFKASKIILEEKNMKLIQIKRRYHIVWYHIALNSQMKSESKPSDLLYYIYTTLPS